MSEDNSADVTPPRSKLVPALLIANSLLLAGVLAVLFLRPSGGSGAAPAEGREHGAAAEEHGEGASDNPTGVGPMVKLSDVVVHLRNPDADRYARVTIEIEVGGEKDKAALAARIPRLRDALIAYFSDRTLEELRGSEGLERTKLALAKRVGEAAPAIRVKGLYVTDLVVQ